MGFLTIVIMTSIIGSVYLQQKSEADSVNEFFEQIRNEAAKISLVNAPLIIIGQGPFPRIIIGIAEIVGKLDANSQTNESIPGYKLNKLCDLMSVLTGKAGLLTQVPVIGPPVAAALRQLEGAVDRNIEAKKTVDANTQADYDACLTMAIKAYDGLTV